MVAKEELRMGDEQKTLLELLKTDPATQGVTAAALALVYKFIRVLKADSREDSIQKQVDKWHEEMVKEVAELRERVDTMARENAGLQSKITELTMTVNQLQLHNTWLIRKLRTYEPNPELTFPVYCLPEYPTNGE